MDRSPENIFRSGILYALKRVKNPGEWVNPPKKQSTHGKARSAIVKPSLRCLATTINRTREEHENAIALLSMSMVAPTVDDTIKMEHVNQSDRIAVLAVMWLSASKFQRKVLKGK